jgi:molybdopterin converting factor small subunit
MQIHVKLVAAMRGLFDRKELVLEFGEMPDIKLKDVVERLCNDDEHGASVAGILLVDASRSDIVPENMNPAVIWLIDDADARLFGGMDAPIGERSVVTIVPSIHGG